MNNDGYADVIVGAVYDDNNGTDSGSARIFSGAMFLQQTTDTDGDGLVDTLDTYPQDKDNDGVADSADAFPLNAAESVDTDNDGTGNNADTDDDGDGIPDAIDSYPLQPLSVNGVYKGSRILDQSTIP